MKNKTYIDDYIKLREIVFIKECRFYCKEMKVPIKRCDEQCDKCSKVVDEKIN